MKRIKPPRPRGRWVYYIFYDDLLWPCPVRWEWVSDYGGWLPFYFSPTFEYIAGDPACARRILNKCASRQRVFNPQTLTARQKP